MAPGLAAPVKPSLALRLRKLRPLLVVAAFATVAFLTVAPSGWGLPTGADKDTIQVAEFAAKGCTSAGCHGGGNFATPGNASVTWTIADATGKLLTGNAYAKGAVYTITITLHNEQNPVPDTPGRHAGFNLRATAGKLDVPAASTDVQVTKDNKEATHTNPEHTNWTVSWTAPDAGPAVFDLFVNDANGQNGADAGDNIYRFGFWLTDSSSAVAGAAAKVEAVEFGISLQQYWIGLIGLTGMIFIMVAGFVYLKFVNPHNTDPKDR